MKIERLETIHLPDYPSILFVAVHTDAGLTGYADTCYMPDAVAGYIHQFAAPMLLGHDPLAIELHWRRLYEVIAHTVGKGAELRGLSAIDVCLWDILGQAAGMPVWQVLGGAARDRIRTYNTCGGPSYGRAAKGRVGYGTDGAAGKYEDLVAFMERPGELAQELLSEGLTGMKLWPFDYVAHFPGGWDAGALSGACSTPPSARSAGTTSAPPTSTARWNRSARYATRSATKWKSWSKGTASGRCRRR